MFNGMLTNIEKASIEFSQNLASWNHSIFISLVLIEFLLMGLAYTFNHTKIEELPIKFYKLVFYVFLANTLFIFLPQIWVMAWDSINWIATKAAGQSIDYSPSEMLSKAFNVVADLFMAADNDANNTGGTFAWLGAKIANTLISIPIAFAVFFLFCIIVTDIVLNYVMWIISGALGGIFILLFTVSSTRPMFYNYMKYMLGLLFKTLTMFLMLSILYVMIDTQIHYKQHLGPAPETPSCLLIEGLRDEASKCTSNDCSESYAVQIKSMQDRCNVESKALAKYQEEANKGFFANALTLLFSMFIFTIIFKTIPSAIAGLVGFGSYDVKGMGQAMGAVAMGGAVGNAMTGGLAGAGAQQAGAAAKAGVAGAAGAVAGSVLGAGKLAGAGMSDGLNAAKEAGAGKSGKAL
ncbi:type IV secretion system protein, partial [Francisella philomiragia]